MSRRTALACIALVLLGAAVALVLWLFPGHALTVENRSGQAIEEIAITVCGQTHTLRGIAPGGAASAAFEITTDGSFDVRGRLADGTALTGNYGYVTRGYRGVRATFEVRPSGEIAFEQDEKG